MKREGNLKLLCVECGTVNPVVDVFQAGALAQLSCGHRRGELLPKSNPSAVGLEDLNTPLGSKHFPQVLEVRPGFVEHR